MSKGIESQYYISRDYPVVVDYNKSLEEMIQACNFDDFKISEARQIIVPVEFEGIQRVAVHLISFQDDCNSVVAIKRFIKMGFRPAAFYECLAFVKDHPRSANVQLALGNNRLIVALGIKPYLDQSSKRRVICFSDYPPSRKRWLNFGWFAYDWPAETKFVTVKEN